MDLDQPTRDFELPDLDGRPHRPSDYRGRFVVVDFWSCECPHSERTDRSLMSAFVQWDNEVVLLTVEALLEGRRPEVQESPAFGCAIVRDI
jgi:peroxiredoxin